MCHNTFTPAGTPRQHLKCYSLRITVLHCTAMCSWAACPTDDESRHHQPVRAGGSRMPGASVLLENLARQLRQRRAPELVPRQGHHHRPSARLQVGPGSVGDAGSHTQSITFRHLPPNSAKIGYSTEGGTFCLHVAVRRRCQRPLNVSVTYNKTVETT